MKMLHLVVTVVMSQVILAATTVALAADEGRVNRQTLEHKYEGPSPIPDYILREGKPYKDQMRVIQPLELPAEIQCERVQVGRRMGYKPNVQRLSTGELVMLNFHTHGETQGASDGSMSEHMVMHRSKDNGKTWTSNHVHGVY